MSICVATLLYSIDYLPGVFSLGYQLRGAPRDCAKCILVDKGLVRANVLSEQDEKTLKALFDTIIYVDSTEIDVQLLRQNANNLSLLGRPELSLTFLKIELWQLVQYRRIIFLDSDVLVVRKEFWNILDALESQKESEIGAAPDCGWPDLFNSGVLAIVPNRNDYEQLLELLAGQTSLDGADQGILNQYFNAACGFAGETSSRRAWNRLPFVYNVTIPNSGYEWAPALAYFRDQINLVHFIGKKKPWISRNGGRYADQWWQNYNSFLAEFYPGDSGTAKAISKALDHEKERTVTNSQSSQLDDPLSSDLTEMTIEEAPKPEMNWEPTWDATIEPPPPDGKPEAAELLIEENYSWSENTEIALPDLPSMPNTPEIKPVFEWELVHNPDEVERVFPG
ncbi:LAMI_0G13982g1_1 [Lachancea mirantina]|uniref:LAMI_0G13982g1_1 n=1 Tax=Lachancea mirantina TaxID=1230905 RepID=A0A1G4KBW1_9SACH|nr:LAMI_0G13982g1_1 [Lachancea mirantina]